MAYIKIMSDGAFKFVGTQKTDGTFTPRCLIFYPHKHFESAGHPADSLYSLLPRRIGNPKEEASSMTAFLQNCLNGISIGSIYALIAIGYTMVYGILRLINFAHGDIFMMAGYFMIICMTDLLIPWYISLLLVVLFTVLLGVFIERIAYKPLRDAPRMSIMISAIGVSYFLQNFATYLFTAQPKSYPYAEMGFLQ